MVFALYTERTFAGGNKRHKIARKSA